MLSMKKNSQYSVAYCSKLYDTLAKSFFSAWSCGRQVVYRQLERVTTGYGAVAIGRHQLKIIKTCKHLLSQK